MLVGMARSETDVCRLEGVAAANGAESKTMDRQSMHGEAPQVQ